MWRSLFLVVLVLTIPIAWSGTIDVTTTEDEFDFIPNGTCSLREAIVTVNDQLSAGYGGCTVSGTLGSNDTIVLGREAYTLTRTGNFLVPDQDRGNLNLLRSVRIVGEGPRVTVIDGDALPKQSDGGVLNVAIGVTVTMRGLAIVNGFAERGAGIFNSGNLALDQVDLRNNRADLSGGGIRNQATGSLDIANSVIRDGLARVSGGGLLNVSGTVRIENSTISNNEANGGGGIKNSGELSLSSVTITNNRSKQSVGGISGGGIANNGSATAVRVENSIVAGNTDTSDLEEPDCAGQFDSRGYNLIGIHTGCTGFDESTDIVGTASSPVSPLLDPLIAYGGPTDTHRLQSGSPAIDAGPLGIIDACLPLDQRGSPRPLDGDGDGFLQCDIGAYEAPEASAPPQAHLAVHLTDDPDPVTAGTTLTYSYPIDNFGPNTAEGVTYTINLPEGSTGISLAGTCAAIDDVTFTCEVDDIAPGTRLNLFASMSAPATADTYIAAVEISSMTDDPYADDNQDQEATFVVSADAADLALSMSGPIGAIVGEELTYVLDATNEGPDAATNVVLANQIPPNTTFVSATAGCSRISSIVSCVIGDLPAGATETFEMVYEAPSSPAVVVNTASVTGSSADPGTSNNNDSISTQVTEAPSADLFIALNAPSTVAAGSTFDIAAIPFNNGPNTSADVVFTVSLDETLEILEFPEFCSVASTVATCELGVMEPFGTVDSHTFQVRAPMSEGSVGASAAISGSVTDPLHTNNEADVASSVAFGEADVAIRKTGPVEVETGAQFAYVVSVFNAGPDPAIDVIVNDELPAGVVLAPINSICTGNTDVVSCDVGTLAVNESATVRIDVTAPDIETVVANTATVDHATTDPNVGNNLATVETTVVAQVDDTTADLRLSKTGPVQAQPSTDIAYGVSVYNAGPASAADVVVVDMLPAGAVFVSSTESCSLSRGDVTCPVGSLAVGDTTELSFVITTPSAEGLVVNAASVSSATDDSDLGNNTDTVETDVLADANPPLLELSVVEGPSAPGNADVPVGDTNIAVVQATLGNLSTSAANIESFTVAVSGPGNASMDLSSVRVYLDRDGGGTVSPEDVGIGTSAPAGGNVQVATSLSVLPGVETTILVAVDAGPGSTTTRVGLLTGLAGVLLLVPLSGRRIGRRVRLGIRLLSLVLLASCAGPSQPVDPPSYALSLTNVTAVDAHTSAPFTVSGLPVQGATITIRR